MWKLFQRLRYIVTNCNLNRQTASRLDELNNSDSSRSSCYILSKYDSSNKQENKDDQEHSKASHTEFPFPPSLCNNALGLVLLGWSTTVWFAIHTHYQKHLWEKLRNDDNQEKNLRDIFQCTFLLNLHNNRLKFGVLPEENDKKIVAATISEASKEGRKSLERKQFKNDEWKNIEFEKFELKNEKIEKSELKDAAIEKKVEEKSIFSELEFEKLMVESDKYISEIQNEVGLGLSKKNRLVEALQYFEAACQFGEKKACFNAGICYENGYGTDKNIEKAKECYEKAAESGHPQAIYNLGLICSGSDNKSEIERGIHLLETAAYLGVKEAQKYMGVYCLNKEEMDKAYGFLKMAAENEDVDSYYYLGLCYEFGWGVEQNLASAAQMYSKAAYKGHLDATYNLAVFHNSGLGGLPENSSVALELFRCAAKAGHEQSIIKLNTNFRRIQHQLKNSSSESDVTRILNTSSRKLTKSWSSDFLNLIFQFQNKSYESSSFDTQRDNSDEQLIRTEIVLP